MQDLPDIAALRDHLAEHNGLRGLEQQLFDDPAIHSVDR